MKDVSYSQEDQQPRVGNKTELVIWKLSVKESYAQMPLPVNFIQNTDKLLSTLHKHLLKITGVVIFILPILPIYTSCYEAIIFLVPKLDNKKTAKTWKPTDTDPSWNRHKITQKIIAKPVRQHIRIIML